MCGRYAITLPPDAMAQLFAAAPANDLPNAPNYNVCPTDQVHVLRAGADGRALVAMRWGFLPVWYKSPTDGPLLINARGETIADKPAFRVASRQRRCVIPASGFYEWTRDDTGARWPWYIHRADGGPILMAGIWQEWHGGDGRMASCAIVTTPANRPMLAIHHRMPVILAPDDLSLWLGEAGTGAAALMRAAPDGDLLFYRVDRAVNSNRARGPELVRAIPG